MALVGVILGPKLSWGFSEIGVPLKYPEITILPLKEPKQGYPYFAETPS